MNFIEIITFIFFIFVVVWMLSKVVDILFYLRGKNRIHKIPFHYHNEMKICGYILVKREYSGWFNTRWAINKWENNSYSNITNDIDSWRMYNILQDVFKYSTTSKIIVRIDLLDQTFNNCTKNKKNQLEMW